MPNHYQTTYSAFHGENEAYNDNSSFRFTQQQNAADGKTRDIESLVAQDRSIDNMVRFHYHLIFVNPKCVM